jgi:trehalose 6-phosphate phosphatase
VEHLLSVWAEVAGRLKDAKNILLLTDYDGTLTPIVERPELAHLPSGTRIFLSTLADKPGFKIGVISGRALSDLKMKVGITGITYAGNHGLEIEGPGIELIHPVAEEIRPYLRLMHYVLSRALATIRGVLVEDKGLSLSVHYRQVDERRTGEVEDVVKRVVGNAEAAGAVKIAPGKKVWDVRPAVNWDKGKVIKSLMKRYGQGGRRSGLLPIYLGDDVTDEDGFKVINNYRNGLSVFVGEPNGLSSACYYLRSPLEVSIFLGNLIEFTRDHYD